MEAWVATRLISAALIPMLGSRWAGSRDAPPESPPPDLYASKNGMAGIALFARWWLLFPVSVAEVDVVMATKSMRLRRDVIWKHDLIFLCER